MQKTRRSTVFLMELIMAILIFSIAATVCVQVFVKSHTLKEESNKLSQAVFASTSVAEIIRSGHDYDVILAKEYPLLLCDNNSYTIFFDEEWNNTSNNNAKFCLEIEIDTKNDFLNSVITVYEEKNKAVIYTLEVKKYIPKEGF